MSIKDFLDGQDSDAEIIINVFSITLSPSSAKFSVETLMEELKLLVLEKYELDFGDVRRICFLALRRSLDSERKKKFVGYCLE